MHTELISAVIFDYGNVLSGAQRMDDVERMASFLGLPAEQFQPMSWRRRMAYDAGQLTPDAYWRTIHPHLSGPDIEHLVALDNHSWSEPNLPMARWAADLRAAGMKTAILSNMPAPMREHVTKSCHWLPEFYARIFSCDVGMTKPETPIYVRCLQSLQMEPGQALFLDDREENVAAARALGMHAICFQGLQEVAEELRRFALPVYPWE